MSIRRVSVLLETRSPKTINTKRIYAICSKIFVEMLRAIYSINKKININDNIGAKATDIYEGVWNNSEGIE